MPGQNENNVLICSKFVCIEPTKEPKELKMKYAIIIGATFGGVFVLALAAICLVRFKKKKKTSGRKRPGSGVMPYEGVFPTPEKYELQNTKSMENILYFEGVGAWTKSNGGKSNEAFD